MSQRLLLIDGYNMMWRTKEFGEALDASLEDARADLVRRIRAYRSRKALFSTIVLVFDGSTNRGGSKECGDGRVRIRFSAYGESADDLIRALVKRYVSRYRITVASDDNYVRNNARAHGAGLISCADLMGLVNGAPKGEPTTGDEKDMDAATAADINKSMKKIWRIT